MASKKIQINLEANTSKANADIKSFATKTKTNLDRIQKNSKAASTGMSTGWNKTSKDIKSFADKSKSNFNGVNKSATNMSGAFTTATGTLKLLTAAAIAYVGVKLIKFFTDSVTAASDLEEAFGKFSVVFKDQIVEAEGWSKVLVSSFAMSTRESYEYLSSVQDLLKPMGMASKEAGKMSFEVVKLAADLGSFNNLPTAKVMADIQSGLVGNYETMKKYGVILNATVVEQEALNMGLVESKKELTAAHKAQAAYSLMIKGSADAMGDMARTHENYANQLKKFKANIEDIKAVVGGPLMDAMNDVLIKTNEWIEANKELMGQKITVWSEKLISGFSALASVLSYLGVVIKGLAYFFGGILLTNIINVLLKIGQFKGVPGTLTKIGTGVHMLTKGFGRLGLAVSKLFYHVALMATSPVGLLVILTAAVININKLIGRFEFFQKAWVDFSANIQKVGLTLKSVLPAIWYSFEIAFLEIIESIKNNWKKFIGWIEKTFPKISKLIGIMKPPSGAGRSWGDEILPKTDLEKAKDRLKELVENYKAQLNEIDKEVKKKKYGIDIAKAFDWEQFLPKPEKIPPFDWEQWLAVDDYNDEAVKVLDIQKRLVDEYNQLTKSEYEYTKDKLYEEYLATIATLEKTLKDKKAFLEASKMAWNIYGLKIKALNIKIAKEREKILKKETKEETGEIIKRLEAFRKASEKRGVLAVQEQKWKEEAWDDETAAFTKATDDQLQAYRSMHSDMKGFREEDFEIAKELIRKQADEYIKLGVDVNTVNEWIKHSNEAAWIDSAIAGDSFVDGMIAGFKQLKKDLTTWGQAAAEIVKRFAETSESHVSTILFDGMMTRGYSFRDAFKAWGEDILKIFTDMVAKMIVQWALFGKAGSGGLAGLLDIDMSGGAGGGGGSTSSLLMTAGKAAYSKYFGAAGAAGAGGMTAGVGGSLAGTGMAGVGTGGMYGGAATAGGGAGGAGAGASMIGVYAGAAAIAYMSYQSYKSSKKRHKQLEEAWNKSNAASRAQWLQYNLNNQREFYRQTETLSDETWGELSKLRGTDIESTKEYYKTAEGLLTQYRVYQGTLNRENYIENGTILNDMKAGIQAYTENGITAFTTYYTGWKERMMETAEAQTQTMDMIELENTAAYKTMMETEEQWKKAGIFNAEEHSGMSQIAVQAFAENAKSQYEFLSDAGKAWSEKAIATVRDFQKSGSTDFEFLKQKMMRGYDTLSEKEKAWATTAITEMTRFAIDSDKAMKEKMVEPLTKEDGHFDKIMKKFRGATGTMINDFDTFAKKGRAGIDIPVHYAVTIDDFEMPAGVKIAPSFQHGGTLPYTGLFYGHKGEEVIPKNKTIQENRPMTIVVQVGNEEFETYVDSRADMVRIKAEKRLSSGMKSARLY